MALWFAHGPSGSFHEGCDRLLRTETVPGSNYCEIAPTVLHIRQDCQRYDEDLINSTGQSPSSESASRSATLEFPNVETWSFITMFTKALNDP
jgi:hypothetical protein